MQTKYSKIIEVVKSRILDGTYIPHKKIGSESMFMKEFGVSRHTVRIAIGDLVKDGWLYRSQGSGTYCADRSTVNGQTKRRKNIAIITTYISDYIFPLIIRGAEPYLAEKGYQVSLYSTNNNVETEKKVLESILSLEVDAAIIEPTKSALNNPNINYYFSLERANIPYIMINAFYDELDPLCLIMDDEKGGYMQTEHLIKQGHTNILGFFKTDDRQGAKRKKGYIKAHRAYQLPIQPENIIDYVSEDKQHKPNQELESILQDPDRNPTAIVAYNDQLVINLLDVLRTYKINVPEDLSLVGFDNSSLATVTEVKLTTVDHPKQRMGEQAAEMIIGLIENRKGPQPEEFQSIIYEPKLIERTSTKSI
ncbi:GntR family transcriptional regulator [Alkalicoccobacillus murimartini]|uniref:GntR family transcriptional regulator of arabinose operon n=1 Tax=Alkalicoccobacillus murimartini TaxID=171685 RepID=A0ABT9YG77_9BACI|nr:GntR family transcriptional regulator [Alkalicoccobacillus murimartini]MDQ0206869.1 GntR family transcriptional regulator of arabinose operon [Alkalicoccobacillus murimartini]